jgi:S-adenosylmethionine:tRNA ribosyltransferase-isomerase
MLKNLIIGDYSYDLPVEKIANFPLQKRDESKLLIYKNDEIVDTQFSNLASFIPAGSLLVLNNSRVIEARIFFTKDTGGRIEIFCLEPYEPEEMAMSMAQTKKVRWQCLIGGASKWKRGQILNKALDVNDNDIELQAKYVSKDEDHFIIEFTWNSEDSFADILHVAGNIPLPPYIKRYSEELDKERYQTIFAEHEGSVAAPTAALHFTEDVFNQLAKNNISKEQITLHVGAGTFKPVKSETIAHHQMHAESFSITLETLQNILSATNIIAAGTTSLRTLESLYWIGLKIIQGKNDLSLKQWDPYEMDASYSYKDCLQAIMNYMVLQHLDTIHCSTSLIIIPGYKFKSANALITNFHQPRSTLLLLIAAFIGDAWKQVYDHALNNNYRFLSYGDSSLLFRNESMI